VAADDATVRVLETATGKEISKVKELFADTPWRKEREISVTRREVCLKHRKIRREIFLRVRVPQRTGSGDCYCILWVVSHVKIVSCL
jgi:hypothetical protein